MKKFTLLEIKETNISKEGFNKLLTFLGKEQADNKYITIKQLIEIIGLSETLNASMRKTNLNMFSDYKKEMILFSINCIKNIENVLRDNRPLGLLEKCKKSIDFLQNEKELDDRYKKHHMILCDLDTNLKKYREYINAKIDFDSYVSCTKTALEEYKNFYNKLMVSNNIDCYKILTSIYTIEAILTLRYIGTDNPDHTVYKIIDYVCKAFTYHEWVSKKEIKKKDFPNSDETYIEFKSFLTEEFLLML